MVGGSGVEVLVVLRRLLQCHGAEGVCQQLLIPGQSTSRGLVKARQGHELTLRRRHVMALHPCVEGVELLGDKQVLCWWRASLG